MTFKKSDLLLANIEILDFDSLAAESYGKIRADLEKAGTPIGPLDMMIAGHAQSLGYTVSLIQKSLRTFLFFLPETGREKEIRNGSEKGGNGTRKRKISL